MRDAARCFAIFLIAAAGVATGVGTRVATANDAPGRAVGDPVRGQWLYASCTACHSLDANDLGPRHRGVMGRHAGRLTDYAYSPALKNSGLTWDAATLDRWLTNPSALVAGTKMFFKVDDAQDRADIIAYLATQN